MKVLLLNGSPHEKGCTYTALCEVAGALEKNGIETEIFQIGNKPVAGCIGCGSCRKTGRCAFYSGSAAFAYKPGAAVASCRRAGTTATLDQLNKYFTINCMPVVSSQYWNMVHGNTPEEVVQDKEGLQIMRTLGNNMAWLLHCIQAGKEQGIALPEREPKEKTNFIR